MGFRSIRAERKARAKERWERRRQLQQTPRDLLRQVVGLAVSALCWGSVAVLWWPDNRWVAVPFLVGGLIAFVILLSILYRLLRGKHQVQIHERAICNACEAVLLPGHMKFHQFEGQECEGAGWVITSRSMGPEVKGREMPVGWVVGATATLALVVALAGSYAWFALAPEEEVAAGETTRQAADVDVDADVEVTNGVDPTKVKVGQCIEDTSSATEEWAPELVEVVDCSQPHAEEVYGRFKLQGRVFLGDEITEELAWVECDKLFEKYVGIPPDDSPLESYVTYPTKESWADSRVVVCTAAGTGDTITKGSVRNTRP